MNGAWIAAGNQVPSESVFAVLAEIHVAEILPRLRRLFDEKRRRWQKNNAADDSLQCQSSFSVQMVQQLEKFLFPAVFAT